MADIILTVAAELDSSSLRRIRSQIEEATKGKPVQVTVGLDTKSAKAISAALTAALATKAIPISVTVDQKSLNQAVKTTTAAFSQILSALGTAAASGVKPGAVGGPGTPASGNALAALDKAKIEASAKNFAQAQMTARTTITTESQKTRELTSQQASLDRDRAKADAAKALAAQEAADRAKLAAANKAADQARQLALDVGKTTRQTTSSGAYVTATQITANATVEKARLANEAKMAETERKKAESARIAADKDSEVEMIKRYQQAAQMYQLGNIADKLQVPYAGQIARQVGSTLQASPKTPYGPTVLAGLGIGALTSGFEFTRNSLKSYGEVETQLTRIRNLTDSTDADIAKFTEQIAGLSKATGRGQAEIAEGLYFIASSGFKGADAMKILQAATMSSVAGMGDAKTMADVLTSAMNSYGIKAGDAFKVTDKFIAAVREGKAEPEALAKSLGAVMPFAREAGVSLEELLGAVSAVTLQTGNAATAGTSIKQAIVSMFAPSKEATGQLDMYFGEGKGAAHIQKTLSTQGLSAALEELYTKSDGSIAELDRIFGNVRALAGVFQLSTNKFANFNEITKKIIDAKDLTMEGYQRGFETWEVQLGMFKQGAEAFKIGFGAFMKPFATGFFHIFGTGLKATGDALAASAIGGIPAGFSSLANSGAGIAAENKGKTPSFLESLIAGVSPVARLASAPNEAAKLAYAIQKMQEGAALDQVNYEWRITPLGLRREPKTYTDSVADMGPMPPMTYPSVMTPEYADFLATQAAIPRGQKGLATAASWPGQSSFAKRGIFDAAFPGKPTPNTRDKFAERDQAVADLVRATEIRTKAVDAAAKLNDEIAGGLATSIEGLINQSQKYDDFFAKYNDIVKKIKDTPDTYQVTTEKGKAVSAKALASEDAKIQQLSLGVKIDEISNKIRAATIARAKTPDAKALAGLRDEAADLRAAARAQELAGLQAGVKSRGTVTYQNPEEKKALDEQRKALQDYNRGTFDTFTGTFTDILKASTKDLPTFNALLKEGGSLMGAFADAAGLLNTSGFVTSLGEAALQAKYLRDNLGAPLKGDAMLKGIGDYGVALQEFKTKMLELNKYMNGGEPVPLDIAVQYRLVTNAPNQFAPGGGSSRKPGAKTTKEQMAALNAPGGAGVSDALLKSLGLGGTGNALEAAINLQVKMTTGNYSEDFAAIHESLQTAANLAENAIKVKVKLESEGAFFWSGKADEKKTIEDGLGIDMGINTSEQIVQKFKENPIPDIAVPQVKITVDSVDTKTAQKEIEKQVGAIKPEPVIVTTVDIKNPTVVGIDEFNEKIRGTMQGLVNGLVFSAGDIEWTAHFKNAPKPPDGPPPPPGGAIGGDVTSSGVLTVGEVGRERVWLPRGAHIFTASETTRMGSLNAGASVETWRGGGQRSYGPSSYTNTTIKVDARGAAEPVRTREQVERGVAAAFNDRTAKRRARETGQI